MNEIALMEVVKSGGNLDGPDVADRQRTPIPSGEHPMTAIHFLNGL